MPTMKQPQKPATLANLLEQPLPIAVDAAQHRFGRNPSVRQISAGDGEIVVELDALGTDAVIIPPKYLGWPVRMIQT